jgi:hypothetical protein
MNATNEVICPTCKGTVAARVNRRGFLQNHILSLFGVYPWKCGGCGSTFLYKKRGERPRARGHEQDSEAVGHKQRQAVKP